MKYFLLVCLGVSVLACNNDADSDKSEDTTKATDSPGLTSGAGTTEPSDSTHRRCQKVAVPTTFTHTVVETTAYYCSGIVAAWPPEGTLNAGDKVNVHEMGDSLRPWIITKNGYVAQIESALKKIE